MHQRSIGSIIGRTSTRTAPLSRYTAQQIHTSRLCLAEENGDSSSATQPVAPRSKSSVSAEAFHLVQGLKQQSSRSPNRALGTTGIDSSQTRSNPTRRVVNRFRGDGRPAYTRAGAGNEQQERVNFSRGRGGRGRGIRGVRGSRGGRTSGTSSRGGKSRGTTSPAIDFDEEAIRDSTERVDTNFSVLTDEDNFDYFHSNQEVSNYAQLADFIDEYVAIENKIQRLTEEAEKLPEDSQKLRELAGEIAGLRASGDDGLKEALHFLVSTESEATPHHTPTDVSINEFDFQIGGIPAGRTGTGNVMEENLRYLANRTKQEFRDPKLLAERLISGEFMKFRDPTEKRRTLKIAEQLEYEADAPKGTEQVGFEPPSQAARKLLAERMVQGKYNDGTDVDFQNTALNNVARITATNASYRANQRDTIFQKIRDLLQPQGGVNAKAAGKGTQKQAN